MSIDWTKKGRYVLVMIHYWGVIYVVSETPIIITPPYAPPLAALFWGLVMGMGGARLNVIIRDFVRACANYIHLASTLKAYMRYQRL